MNINNLTSKEQKELESLISKMKTSLIVKNHKNLVNRKEAAEYLIETVPEFKGEKVTTLSTRFSVLTQLGILSNCLHGTVDMDELEEFIKNGKTVHATATILQSSCQKNRKTNIK